MMFPASARWWLAGVAAVSLAVGSIIAAERSSSAMATAATKFLAGLTPEQRQQAALPVRRRRAAQVALRPAPRRSRARAHHQGDERSPAQARARPAEGRAEPARLPDGIVDHGSRDACSASLEAAERAAAGAAGAQCALVRDPERYFFSVFGTPSAKDTWGWRVEGHHVSLHFTVVNGTLVAGSPSFFGSNPAEVREGPKKGLRILGAEEDGGADAPAGARRLAAHEGDFRPDGAERHDHDGERRHHAAVAGRHRRGA